MRSSSSKAGFGGSGAACGMLGKTPVAPFGRFRVDFALAVALCRNYLKKHPLERGSLDDMEKELKRTLTDAARYINKTYDVEGLHSSFPERLDKLKKRMGDRLTKH